MGKDIKRLQDLITSLETVQKEEEKKKAQLDKTTNQMDTINTNNTDVDANTSDKANIEND